MRSLGRYLDRWRTDKVDYDRHVLDCGQNRAGFLFFSKIKNKKR